LSGVCGEEVARAWRKGQAESDAKRQIDEYGTARAGERDIFGTMLGARRVKECKEEP